MADEQCRGKSHQKGHKIAEGAAAAEWRGRRFRGEDSLGLFGNPNTELIRLRLTRTILEKEQGIKTIKQTAVNAFDGGPEPIALRRVRENCDCNDDPGNNAQNCQNCDNCKGHRPAGDPTGDNCERKAEGQETNDDTKCECVLKKAKPLPAESSAVKAGFDDGESKLHLSLYFFRFGQNGLQQQCCYTSDHHPPPETLLQDGCLADVCRRDLGDLNWPIHLPRFQHVWRLRIYQIRFFR